MKIYVGNLSFNLDDAGLEGLFAPHGQVHSARVATDRETGRPRGFGFVEMSDQDAQTAIKALNGSTVDGRAITVNEARPKESRPRSGGGGGGRW